jgi:LAO/AO transport system kinase
VHLGRAITLAESKKAAHRAVALEILDIVAPFTGKSKRIGITGVPGVGKSTFIEALGMHLVQQGLRVAVLAVDPSSQVSKGSILGDKTRMTLLSASPLAFIRPSPSGTTLGGVAEATRDSLLLCEAAGYDVVLIETVGVGQSETVVQHLTDCFLLLLLPGAGDELQGIKRGIVEMADLLIVNKAEEERMALAREAKRAYINALHLFPLRDKGWKQTVLHCSSLTGQGIPETWSAISEYFDHMQGQQRMVQMRKEQSLYWMHAQVHRLLEQHFYNHPKVAEAISQLELDVTEGRCSPFKAAGILLDLSGWKVHNS